MKRIFFLGLICASGVLWFAITQRKAALPTQTQAEPTSENSPTPDSQPQEFANRNQRHPIQIKKRKFSAIPPTQPQNLLRVEAQLEESALQQTIANLISPQTGFSQKQAIWKQLRDEGKLDDVIKELEQRTSGNPNTAEIPTALGQAYVNKIQIATDARDPAILGLKADQSFDAALKLDPSNWEAGFFKAASLSYWPIELNKGEEVIQRFNDLINQQETMPPQSHFAESYTLLGTHYQKSGYPDYALQVWQRGAALFPADETLKKKLESRP